MSRILLIDDDEQVAQALQAAFQVVGNVVEIATEAEQGLIRAAEEDFDVVITDLHWGIAGSKRPQEKGLELVEQLHKAKPHLPIILMTAFPAPETTIQATQFGACDYVTKPGTDREIEELIETVRKAAAGGQHQIENGPAAELSSQADIDELGQTARPHNEILGRSWAMQNVLKEIGRVAAKPVTVLILGETGTGKELVARALHAHSGRANGPFIIVNCVAIPESLLESELFGHEPGSFTGATARRIGRFEQANRGTIFLDEIGDMVPSTQAKLLRVLQDQTIQRLGARESFQVNVRVLAATHRELDRAVERNEFRSDLYYRLNDAVIRLPPLRERKEDIPELVEFFLQHHAAELHAVGSTIDPAALDFLQKQTWPGNVRELKNIIRKALLLARGRRINLEIIRKTFDDTRLFHRLIEAGGVGSEAPSPSLSMFVSHLLDRAQRGERQDASSVLHAWVEGLIFCEAFRLAEGDHGKAAKWLGVSRPTFREKIARYQPKPESEPVHEEQLA